MAQDELERLRKRKAQRQLVRRLVLLFLLCGALLTLYFVGEYLLQTGTLEDWFESLANPTASFPVALAGGTPLTLQASNRQLAVLTDTNLSVYRTGGRQLLNVQHLLTSPILVSAGERLLLFDQAGRSLTAYLRESETAKLTTEYAITTAAIHENGLIAVVTGALQHIGQVSVYDASGQTMIFQWLSAAAHITDVAFSPDGNGIAVTCVESDKTSLLTTVYFFRFDQAEPVAVAQLADMLPISTTYKTDGVFVIGATYCAMVGQNGSIMQLTDYAGSSLLDFSNESAAGAVVVLEDYTHYNTSHTLIFDASGVLRAEFQATAGIRDVHYGSDSTVTLLDSGMLYVLSAEGELLFREEVSMQSVGAVKLEDSLYLLDLDYLRQLDYVRQSPEALAGSSSETDSHFMTESVDLPAPARPDSTSESHESSDTGEESVERTDDKPEPITQESSLSFG